MKCPNCGDEVADGMKFCGTCGTKIPQDKKCPGCGAIIPEKMKFCPECGCPQDGAAAKPKFNAAAIAMGDKNVIAGDVTGKKEETHISGNATIIKNEDQSKQVKRCHVCGKMVLITQGFECPSCGEFTCENCYDGDSGLCRQCAQKKSGSKAESYRAAVREALADGKIDFTDRRKLDSLQRELGLDREDALAIEAAEKEGGGSAKAAGVGLSAVEKIEFEAISELFYGGNDKDGELLARAEKLYEAHRMDEQVLGLYLPILAAAEGGQEKAMGIIKALPVDVLSAYMTATDICIAQKDLVQAEDYIKRAKAIWQDDPSVLCREACLSVALYKQYGKKEFLDSAQGIEKQLEAMEADDKQVKRWRLQLIKNLTLNDAKYLKKLTIENGVLTKCAQDVSGEVTIPDGVTEIGEKAFAYCTSLASVVIPEGVKSIGTEAFRDCESLSSVTIPEGVTEIGRCAFRGCAIDSLEHPCLTIKGGIVIEEGTLLYCANAKASKITISEGVTKIGEKAFQGCASLASVVIPGSVKSIGGQAFSGCESLASVVIPDGVTEIGSSAFKGCESLASVTIPSSVKSIGHYAFDGCSSLASVVIPDGVTEIGGHAFDGCSSLRSVVIPDSVTKIGSYAFSGCFFLDEASKNRIKLIENKESVDQPVKDNKLTIENGVLTKCAKDVKGEVTIPDGVTKIGAFAFNECKSLTSVAIPEGVTVIGESSFKGCSSLASVTIPSSVKSIGYYAFDDCESLASVTILGSVTKIGAFAFRGCSSLTSVAIPEGVTVIGEDAFSGCGSLDEASKSRIKLIENSILAAYVNAKLVITNASYSISGNKCTLKADRVQNDSKAATGRLRLILWYASSPYTGGSMKDINGIWMAKTSYWKGLSAGYGYPDISSTCDIEKNPETGDYHVIITLEEENDKGGSYIMSWVNLPGTAHWNHESVDKAVKDNKLTIKDNKLTIENGVLTKCAQDVKGEVTIPDGVTEIGKNAFWFCCSLSSVTIPDGVTKIGSGAFTSCHSLASVVIPEGVTEIGGWAFDSCESLASVVIPDGVTEIGEKTFYNCSSLASVVIPEGVKVIGSYAFYGCHSLTSVVIPEGVTEIGSSAFSACFRLTSVTIPCSVTKIGEQAFYFDYINFQGTKAQWENVHKAKKWDYNMIRKRWVKTVRCSDGDLTRGAFGWR